MYLDDKVESLLPRLNRPEEYCTLLCDDVGEAKMAGRRLIGIDGLGRPLFQRDRYRTRRRGLLIFDPEDVRMEKALHYLVAGQRGSVVIFCSKEITDRVAALFAATHDIRIVAIRGFFPEGYADIDVEVFNAFTAAISGGGTQGRTRIIPNFSYALARHIVANADRRKTIHDYAMPGQNVSAYGHVAMVIAMAILHVLYMEEQKPRQGPLRIADLPLLQFLSKPYPEIKQELNKSPALRLEPRVYVDTDTQGNPVRLTLPNLDDTLFEKACQMAHLVCFDFIRSEENAALDVKAGSPMFEANSLKQKKQAIIIPTQELGGTSSSHKRALGTLFWQWFLLECDSSPGPLPVSVLVSEEAMPFVDLLAALGDNSRSSPLEYVVSVLDTASLKRAYPGEGWKDLLREMHLLVDGPVDKETAEELTQVSGETFYCVITRGSSFSFEKWHLGLLPGGGSYSEGYARYPRVFPEEFVGEHPYALLIMEDAVLRVVRLLPQEIKSMRPLTLLAKPEVLELLRLRRDNRVPYGELQRVANGHLQPGQPGLPNDPTDVGFLSPEDLQSARVVQAMAAARELLHIDDVQQPPDQGTRGGRIAWRIVKILLLILCGLALLGFVLLALHVQQAP